MNTMHRLVIFVMCSTLAYIAIFVAVLILRSRALKRKAWTSIEALNPELTAH